MSIVAHIPVDLHQAKALFDIIGHIEWKLKVRAVPVVGFQQWDFPAPLRLHFTAKVYNTMAARIFLQTKWDRLRHMIWTDRLGTHDTVLDLMIARASAFQTHNEFTDDWTCSPGRPPT